MNQHNQQPIKVSVAITIIAGVLGALSALGGSIDPSTAKIFSISMMLILFGITGTISWVVTNKPEYKTLGIAGMAASLGAFLLFFIMILSETGGDILIKLAFTLSITAIALAHICLLYHITIQNKYAAYARIAATTAIALFSFFIIIQIFQPLPDLYMMASNQSTIKTISALLLVDLAATLLVPLCNRLKIESPVEELQFTPEEPPASETQTPVE
jgi:hypothetical protein